MTVSFAIIFASLKLENSFTYINNRVLLCFSAGRRNQQPAPASPQRTGSYITRSTTISLIKSYLHWKEVKPEYLYFYRYYRDEWSLNSCHWHHVNGAPGLAVVVLIKFCHDNSVISLEHKILYFITCFESCLLLCHEKTIRNSLFTLIIDKAPTIILVTECDFESRNLPNFRDAQNQNHWLVHSGLWN